MNGGQQIGLLGGSFNPVTKAHIEIAKAVISKTDIDKIWLTPCYEHIQKNKLEDSSHRIEMCRLATTGIDHVNVFDYEIKNRLKNGTYDFVQKLLEDNELSYERDFSYIIGMDNVKIFNTWIKHEELKNTVRFIVIPRPGNKPLSENEWYNHPPHVCLKSPTLKMSSTHVRFLLKLWWNNIGIGKSILKYFILRKIDAEVFQYIVKNNLYK